MAEMLANNLIRLLVTVAILGAVYLFAIKPILDTTDNAFDSVGGQIDRAFGPGGLQSEIQDSFDDAGILTSRTSTRAARATSSRPRSSSTACRRQARTSTS